MDPKQFTNQKPGRVIQTQTAYWAFLPSPLPPEFAWSTMLVSILAEAERELGRLSSLADGFPFPRLLIQPFIRNEAVLSSRIEGTKASLVDLYRYETTQLSFFEQTNDVKEVFNYVQAMDYGLERLKTFPVSLRLIREIHAKLLQDVRGGNLSPGEFRRTQNWIGPAGSTPTSAPYVPPPVEEMYIALNALEKFIHSNSEIPALVRAGLIHYQFEAIHPFLDGNGRIGRLLTVLLICEWGLLKQPMLNLSTYFEQYRQDYYDHLLAISQHGKWEEWLIFFLRGVSQQSKESVNRLNRLQIIRNDLQTIVTTDRNPERMSAVIDFLFTRPILTIRQAEAGLGFPYKTIADYFEKLVRAGTLRELTGNARNRIFQADEIFRAVQGLD